MRVAALMNQQTRISVLANQSSAPTADRSWPSVGSAGPRLAPRRRDNRDRTSSTRSGERRLTRPRHVFRTNGEVVVVASSMAASTNPKSPVSSTAAPCLLRRREEDADVALTRGPAGSLISSRTMRCRTATRRPSETPRAQGPRAQHPESEVVVPGLAHICARSPPSPGGLGSASCPMMIVGNQIWRLHVHSSAPRPHVSDGTLGLFEVL